MQIVKSWKVVPFAACLSIIGACGTAQDDGSSTEEVTTPPAGSAGRSAPAMSGSAGSAGKPAAGAGGMKAASPGSSSAGTSAGAAGAAGTMAVSAVAVLEPFMAGETSAGAAGAGGGAAGTGANAGAGGAAGKAGAAGSSNAGAGGRAGAGGNGAGAGLAALSGTATFTKASSTQVDVNIEVTGCEDGKSYPVHIHEGMSCESTATQGAHWGEPQAFMLSAAGAGGGSATGAAGAAAAGSGGSAGSAGHDASHAGAGGAAGSPATSFKYRGEGIPDIKCTGTTGSTLAKRNSFDKRVTWSLGTGDESDVVGHVVVVHDGAARIACGKIELK